MAYTTINKSSEHFNTKLYTGNGGTQSITGVGFQPDLNWTKARNVGTFHMLTDAVRGATKVVQSNISNAEQTFAQGLTSFDSDGFTAGNSDDINGNYNYASWNWKANGTGSSNTDGSITSTVSANTTSGFSIVTYTGTGSNATIGHGLGSTPKFIIVKCRSHISSWMVYYGDNTNFLKLDTSVATEDLNTVWNDTSPTNSVFTLGTNGDVNTSGRTYVAYCFADVTGYSKFGSYIGNGSTDGTFVYTGFSPSFILWKSSSNAEHWWIIDNKRTTYNPTNNLLRPDISDVELVGNANMKVDFLSNGFKLRQTDNALNGSGASYIYMVFASAPLVGTNNIPATAR